MADPDPVLAVFSSPSTGRNRLRDLLATALYGVARREWQDEQPEGDPVAYAATWTASRIDGLRSQADAMLDADARFRRLRDLTLSAWLRKAAASALAGLLLILLLAGGVLGGLRLAGVDVAGVLVQACLPDAPPRYVGQRR